MAKVKKMAFGGMGRMAAGMGASRPGMGRSGQQQQNTSAPPGSIKPQQLSPEQARAMEMQRTTSNLSAAPMQSQMQQAQAAQQMAQLRGGLGGNQAPAGANLMQGYGAFAAPDVTILLGANAQKPAAGSNLMQAYQAKPGQGAGVPDYAKPYMAQAGQPTSPPAPKLAGMGAFMKKGGKVKAKAYAKGGTVSSASKRGDGCAQRGKTKGRMV